MLTKRTHFISVGFDCLTMDEVLGLLAKVSARSPYAYLVTPNVDHVVRLNDGGEGELLKPLYEQAGLSLCDSRVLKMLARMQGIYLPLVPGSDLTARLLREVVQPKDSIAIVGGDKKLLQQLKSLFPHVRFTQHIPPMGLRNDIAAQDAAADFVISRNARFVFLAVGSPQQEMIAAAVYRRGGARGLALCVGASLDFVVGLQRRAPRPIQLLCLEWAYRLCRNPRRMWRRYVVEGPRVFNLALRHYRCNRGNRGTSSY